MKTVVLCKFYKYQLYKHPGWVPLPDNKTGASQACTECHHPLRQKHAFLEPFAHCKWNPRITDQTQCKYYMPATQMCLTDF